MRPKTQAIETSLGTIHRRSAFILRSIEYPRGTSELVFTGTVGGYACRPKPMRELEFSFRLRFLELAAHRVVELDSWVIPYDVSSHPEPYPSLYQVFDADWPRTLGPRVTSRHRHYVFSAYDEVYELVAAGLEFEVVGTRRFDDWKADA